MPDERPETSQHDLAALRHQIAKLRQHLAASERRERVLRQLLDNLPSAIYATGHDGMLITVNTSFAARWGKHPRDFEGRTLGELFPPEIAAAWQQNVDAALHTPGITIDQETYGDGEQARHFDTLRFPIYDDSGTAVALGGAATDITDRVRAETSYADTRLILEGVVNNSPAAIYVKSHESRLMLVNQACATIIGRPVEELVDRTEDEIFPPEVVANWRESDRLLFTRGEPTHTPTVFAVNDELRDFITVEFPLYDRERNPYAICSISTDVTELKRVERERVQLQNEIIEAQQLALRELNTPLIPLADGVVVMPLIGSLDNVRAAQVLETLLEGVSTHRARIAIVDITGLPVVDTQVASALLQAAQAVKLLGAEVLLTGIGPEVAQTLVGIGADLRGLQTPGSLQAGIQYALRQ